MPYWTILLPCRKGTISGHFGKTTPSANAWKGTPTAAQMDSHILGEQPTRWKWTILKSAVQKSRHSNSSGIRKRKAASPRRLRTDTQMQRWKLLRRRILESGWARLTDSKGKSSVPELWWSSSRTCPRWSQCGSWYRDMNIFANAGAETPSVKKPLLKQ